MEPAFRRKLIDTFRWIDLGRRERSYGSDASGWWRDPSILLGLGPALADLFRAGRPTVVVAPERSGYVLGPLAACALEVGFVEAYKDVTSWQVSDQLLRRATPPDYRDRTVTMGIRARHLKPSDRVLVVDDWIETGAQVTAVKRIVEDAGSEYVGTAVIVNGCSSDVRRLLRVRSLLHVRELDVER